MVVKPRSVSSQSHALNDGCAVIKGSGRHGSDDSSYQERPASSRRRHQAEIHISAPVVVPRIQALAALATCMSG